MKKEETQLDDTSIFKLIKELAKKYPNDADLGEAIRKAIINTKPIL